MMRWLLLLLLLAPFAQAQAATEAQAIQTCMADADFEGGYCYGPNNVDDGTPQTGTYSHCRLSSRPPAVQGKLFTSFQSGQGNCASGSGTYAFTSRCLGGVDYANGTCFPDPPSNEECLALNAEPGFINSGPRSRTYTSTCLANGCRWEVVSDHTQSVVNGFTIHSGTFEFTGACTPGSGALEEGEETPRTSQECTAASGGQTFCLKGNGEHCYTASTGKQICWTPGETGTKTADNVAQKRVAGTNPPTAPPPPEGESFTQGPSTTATTTKDGVTMNTTTTNFITVNGTDAGETDSGEPDDGTGEPEEGDSGVEGGTCSAGYVCSGDAVQCAILEEAHNERCAREGLATELNDAAEDYGFEADPSTAFGTGNLAETVLDTTGWLGGGGTCPVDNLPEMPDLDLVGAVCPGASVLAIYVYLLGLIHCAKILGRAASGTA